MSFGGKGLRSEAPAPDGSFLPPLRSAASTNAASVDAGRPHRPAAKMHAVATSRCAGGATRQHDETVERKAHAVAAQVHAATNAVAHRVLAEDSESDTEDQQPERTLTQERMRYIPATAQTPELPDEADLSQGESQVATEGALPKPERPCVHSLPRPLRFRAAMLKMEKCDIAPTEKPVRPAPRASPSQVACILGTADAQHQSAQGHPGATSQQVAASHGSPTQHGPAQTRSPRPSSTKAEAHALSAQLHAQAERGSAAESSIHDRRTSELRPVTTPRRRYVEPVADTDGDLDPWLDAAPPLKLLSARTLQRPRRRQPQAASYHTWALGDTSARQMSFASDVQASEQTSALQQEAKDSTKQAAARDATKASSPPRGGRARTLPPLKGASGVASKTA